METHEGVKLWLPLVENPAFNVDFQPAGYPTSRVDGADQVGYKGNKGVGFWLDDSHKNRMAGKCYSIQHGFLIEKWLLNFLNTLIT